MTTAHMPDDISQSSRAQSDPHRAPKPDPAIAWLERLAGQFIVFDGPDGSGKSTQLAKLAQACHTQQIGLCQVRDPGGSGVGEHIRQVLLDHANERMSIRCEMLLYMASRAELVDKFIKPALNAGELVLADRFVSSTLAYQGNAGGLMPEEIRSVAQVATGGLWPDLTIIFDVDPATASARMTGTSHKGKSAGPSAQMTLSLFADRMEAKGQAFHERVRAGYLALAKADPDHTVVIDATRDEQAVFDTLLDVLGQRYAAQPDQRDQPL